MFNLKNYWLKRREKKEINAKIDNIAKRISKYIKQARKVA